jgi:tetratricopeptide (TPR) repeat protein/DNA-binding CsgD family transcriptional regulator
MMDAMPQALVGRISERRRLAEWLTEAAQGRPSVVFLSGDAGAGKSSLVTWLVQTAQEQRALLLRGGCIELGSGSPIPYYALTEGLRLFTRSKGQEHRQLLESRPWSTLTSLTSDPGSGRPTTDSQNRIFGAVLLLSDFLGRKHSVLLLVFEDMHWADPSTLDLVRHLASAKSDEKLLVLCTHRPVPSRHPLRALLGEPAFYRQIEQVRLPLFTRQELAEFVTGRAAELGRTVAPDRLDRYFELSEGNAYYAEQLMIADDPETSDVVVPLSLREAMMARLAQLSDAAREVAQVAAVAGRRLDDVLLTAVSELDDRILDEALSECLNRQILVQDHTDHAYSFQHALLRDVAYTDIRPARRLRLHERMATAMAAVPGAATRLQPELAHHWFAAGQLPRAFEAAVRAAEMAARVGAFPEATGQYERVMSLWPDVPDAVERAGATRERVLGRAADAARWSGNLTRALEWVRQAMADVTPATDAARAGELHERLGSYLWEAGEEAAAATAYIKAERLLAGLPPSALASRVKAALATTVIRRGDYQTGGDYAREAIALARSANARPEEGRALSSLGLALTFEGEIDQAIEVLRAAVAIARDGDHFEDVFRAYGFLGVCLEEGGRLEETVATMTEGLAYAKEYGLLNTRPSDVLAGNAAVAEYLLGRYAQAASLLDPILRRRPVAESRYARLTRAEIHVAEGQYAAAERLLLDVSREPISDPRFVGPLFGCTAELEAWQGRLDRADEVMTQGLLRVAGTTSARVIVQLCATGLRIAADRADGDQADVLGDRVREFALDDTGSELGLLARQCAAEHARAHGIDTPEMWRMLAEGWRVLHQPFRVAYARLRQANAAGRAGDRGQATNAATEALDGALTIGAVPLHALVEETIGALNSTAPYGLTPTELYVLKELATGATYAVIADRRSVSPNTIGVHVKKILRKMGVRNRHEATVKARKDGVLDA